MQIHLHLGKVPLTISITKGDDPELEELRDALLWYGMRLPVEGARARLALRRWAKAAR